MQLVHQQLQAQGIRFSAQEEGNEIGHAYLYILKNDLHQEPFGLVEDVFVQEDQRGKGMGTALITQIIKEAKQQGCYKLILTSRHGNEKARSLYEKLGFKNHGWEYRMDL